MAQIKKFNSRYVIYQDESIFSFTKSYKGWIFYRAYKEAAKFRTIKEAKKFALLQSIPINQ